MMSPGGGFGGGMSPSGAGGFGNTAATMAFDLEQTLDGPPSFDKALKAHQKQTSLAADDTLNFGAEDEELEQMDHEIFEPLNSFDPDMRELLIDTVNEKVRRILSLDPSKFENGKLPFGLRPDKKSNIEEELEAEIRKLNARIKELEEERDRYKQEAEELRRKIEEMRKRAGLPPEEHEPQVVQQAPPPQQIQRAGRGPAPPKEEVEAPPPQQLVVEGLTEKEVQKRIAEACKELNAKIAMLEAQLKQKNKEIEDLRKRLMEAMKPKKEKKEKVEEPEPEEEGPDETLPLKRRIRELEEQLRKSEKDREAAEDAMKELQRLLDEERSKPPPPPAVQKVVQKVDAPPEVDTFAVRKAQELLYKVLMKAGKELQVPPSDGGQAAVQKLLGDDPEHVKVKVKKGKTKAQAEAELCDQATPALEEWTSEILQAFEGLRKRIYDLENKPPKIIKEVVEKEAPVVKMKEESPREGKCYKKEHDGMEKRIKELEDEIARLLLTIDELRRRIEQLQAIPMDPDEEETVKSIMTKVGLQELAEASAGGGQKLKGVFERLYQDSVQRIQRYGMVRERMLLATKAYNSVVSSMGAGQPDPNAIPDFERLNETTRATLSGMWYNTEKIFKRCCEHAMSQGVEHTLLRTQGRKDLMGDLAELDTGAGLTDELPKARRTRDRLPGRRGERPQKLAGAAPTKAGKDAGTPTSQSFTSYVAQLREAQTTTARGEEFNRSSDKVMASPDRRVPSRQESAAALDNFKTLREACAPSSAGSAGNLSASRSLPALPRGRGYMQGADSPEAPLGKLPFSPSQFSAAVDARSP